VQFRWAEAIDHRWRHSQEHESSTQRAALGRVDTALTHALAVNGDGICKPSDVFLVSSAIRSIVGMKRFVAYQLIEHRALQMRKGNTNHAQGPIN
jgi:hypothetical protein